nr:hypothetical protein [Tanacetum cinerariifolium]
DDVIVEDAEMLFDVADDLRGEEVFVLQEVPPNAAATATTALIVDITLAQALAELKKEQDELTNAEKAKLFMEFLEKRRKFFAAKRAEEKRNRPTTKAQQRIIMSTYLKNMDGWKLKSLKNKSFAEIQELFDKAMKNVNTFVDYRTELKVEDDKEFEELKKCLEIIPNDGDEVTIDATPLSSKSPTIFNYKIYQEGKKSYFQIFRADGLQIHQFPRGIFINQAKYTLEIIKKHGMERCESLATPLATKPKLDADLSGLPVDQTKYRSMIRLLMYLTSSRPDLVQTVCYCARYQAKPTEKHLKEVKRVLRYLKGTINMGLWYPKYYGFKLIVFSDDDHAGCINTRKITFRGIQFIGDKLVSWMSKKQDYTVMSLAKAE